MGTVFAERYRLERLIARGGMGRVYLGTQLPIRRPVAVKVLTPALEHVDPKFEERFLLEAAISAKLSHPHIVTVHDYGEAEGGKLFIAMEYLKGQPLYRILARRKQPLDGERIMRISIQVCRALREAHAKGVIHRDLKPGNIMLLQDAEDDQADFVKVLDFGLVKVLEGNKNAFERDERDLTRAGTLLGSPRYMSPEQIKNERLDPRTDIYSLGCIMYHMAAGQPPFNGKTSIDTMHMHMHDLPPPLSRCSPELAELIMCCLEKDPDDRYQSMSELIHGLRNTARRVMGLTLTTDRLSTSDVDQSTGALPLVSTVPPPLPVDRPTSVLPEPIGEASAKTRWGPRQRARRRMAVLIGTVVLAVAVIALIWASRSSPVPEVQVALRSDPSGASVWSNDVAIGVTPMVRRFQRAPAGTTQTFIMRLAGHRDTTVFAALDQPSVVVHAKLSALPPLEVTPPPEAEAPEAEAPEAEAPEAEDPEAEDSEAEDSEAEEPEAEAPRMVEPPPRPRPAQRQARRPARRTRPTPPPAAIATPPPAAPARAAPEPVAPKPTATEVADPPKLDVGAIDEETPGVLVVDDVVPTVD